MNEAHEHTTNQLGQTTDTGGGEAGQDMHEHTRTTRTNHDEHAAATATSSRDLIKADASSSVKTK
jgi:hypothetical protein